MTPLSVIAAGAFALAAGALVLLSYGNRYRVGRLLAATPSVTVEQAIHLAEDGAPRYVRVDGRLNSAEDFPDEHHRPLIFRRRRLEVRRGRRWQTLEDTREAVPFELREGLATIAIDNAALDRGLVVLPRESTGTASDIADRVPAGTPPEAPARLRVEQISSVEHAVVLGLPARGPDGPRLTAGLGRPLVLTTLEVPEAMRILGGGRMRAILAALLLVAGLGLLGAGLFWALVAGLR